MMKALYLASLLAFAVLVMAVSPAAQARIDMAFRAAVETETIKGDLKGAIEQYKAVVAKAGPDRALAAQALMRMADCYQKLGDAEARKVYERVIRDFAEQAGPVATARARLVALGSTAGSPRTGVIVRQIWTGDGVDLGGEVSPDGRYLAFVQDGQVAVRNMSNGERRVLTRLNDGYPTNLIFSSDGNQIAFSWDVMSGTTLHVVTVDGSRQRVLVSTPGISAWPRAWAPDAKRIAVNLRKAGNDTNMIAFVSTVDGTITQLKSTGWQSATIGGFSPDGRFITYSLPRTSSSEGGIFAIATDGSREAPLVKSPAIDTSPMWTADGRAVVFMSDRSGTNGLWSVQVADGKPQGPPEMVRANLGSITPLGLTRDGSYFYGTRNEERDIYIANFDPETLTTTAAPIRLSERLRGSNIGPSWSPDGQSVAFFRGTNRREMSVVVHSLLSGTERTVPTTFENGYFAAQVGPKWFPDGRSFMVVEDTDGGRRTFVRVDIETGRKEALLHGSEKLGPIASLSPDGKTLYYSYDDEIWVHLMKKELTNGIEVELYRAERIPPGIGFIGLSASPDGAHLSFLQNLDEEIAVMTVSAQGGAARELYRRRHGGSWPGPINGGWTRDGRYTLMRFKVAGPVSAVPLEGGEPRSVNVRMQGTPSVSSDGRRLAFTVTERRPEVWVIQDFLPAPPAQR